MAAREAPDQYFLGMNANSLTHRPAVVLLSGGLDSATVLALARSAQGGSFAVHTIAFDYGQRHRYELESAAHVAAALGAASHRVIAIDLRAFGGSALTDEIDVPKDRIHGGPLPHSGQASRAVDVGGAESPVPVTYVPARNLVFLSLATAYAETINSRDIFIGVNAVDYSGYPDCRPEFIRAFEAAANLGTALGTTCSQSEPAGSLVPRIHIHAPLVQLSKAEIIRLGVSLGVDYGLTHSCYDPVVREGETLACGHCDSCILRREGFTAAKVLDPTRYA
jgi:7-cyano-7-deazaguanine synthase